MAEVYRPSHTNYTINFYTKYNITTIAVNHIMMCQLTSNKIYPNKTETTTRED